MLVLQLFLQSLNLEIVLLPVNFLLIVTPLTQSRQFLYFSIFDCHFAFELFCQFKLDLPNCQLLVDVGRCHYFCILAEVHLREESSLSFWMMSSLIVLISVLQSDAILPFYSLSNRLFLTNFELDSCSWSTILRKSWLSLLAVCSCSE